ncbi:MAG: mechanosensitive ion channel domain-containing protein [bacterium]
MIDYIKDHPKEFIYSVIVLSILFLISYLIRIIIKKIARSSNKNEARSKLIGRYVNVTLLLIAILVEAVIFGADWADISVIFSSVFAVIGIALFAVWSILSNVTSGVIMFFSFPYKVGDKIEIHDKDVPLVGIIEDIRAFHLHLRQENGDLITYPNNLMLQKAVTIIQKDAINELEL